MFDYHGAKKKTSIDFVSAKGASGIKRLGRDIKKVVNLACHE